MEAALGVAIEEEALLLAVRFVEHDKAADGFGRFVLGGNRHVHSLGEARPLGEVACGVEVSHAGCVVAVSGALVVA